MKDGYIGKLRPHYLKIDESEFEEDMTKEDIEDMIEQFVFDDFQEKVSFYWEIV